MQAQHNHGWVSPDLGSRRFFVLKYLAPKPPRLLAGAAQLVVPVAALAMVDQPRLTALVASNAWGRRCAAVVAWAAAETNEDEKGAEDA